VAEALPKIESRYGPRGEELVIRFNRRKALLFGVLWAVMGLLTVGALFVDPTEPWLWAGVLLFLVLPFVVARRWGSRGLLGRKPLLVLDPQGFQDNQSGVRVEWEEIERIEPREVSTRGGTQLFLGIYPHDEEAVLERLGSVAGRAARLTRKVFRGEAPLNIPLQFADASVDEVVAAIRRYWKGPIEGYDADFDVEFARRKPKSRLRRFAEWIAWAGFGLVVAIILIALTESCS
jgi:hypothetical protein